MTKIRNFRDDESGAVTVDFVVLTAGIVMLGLLVGSAIVTGGQDLGERTGQFLTDCELGGC